MGVYSSTNPDYLADVQIHQFCEDSTLTECGFETIAMANHEWNSIVESVDINEVSLFEAELLGIQEADKKDSGFVDKLKALGSKIIEMLKKIAAYIFGMISKWIIAITKLINKDAYTTKDKGRLLRGANKLFEKAKDSKIHLYGLLCNKHDYPNYDAGMAELGQTNKKALFTNAANITQADLADARGTFDALVNDIRGAIVGKPTIEAKDFAAEVRLYLTGHKEVAEYTFDKNNIEKAIGEALATINGGGAKHKERAKKNYDNIKKNINAAIENVKSVTVKAKDIKDDEKRKLALESLQITGKYYNAASSVMAAANSTFLSVMSADLRMSASLLVKCHGAGTSDEQNKKDEKKKKEEEKKTKSMGESTESIFGTDLI